MFKLFKLIQKLFDDEVVSSIWYANGLIWTRKLNYGDSCPAIDYYDAPWRCRERLQPLADYPAWQVRLVAAWISGAGLSYKEGQSKKMAWSLEIAS